MSLTLVDYANANVPEHYYSSIVVEHNISDHLRQKLNINVILYQIDNKFKVAGTFLVPSKAFDMTTKILIMASEAVPSNLICY